MSKNAPSFFKRYLVTIVMVPAIVGLHFGWSLMQKNRSLVREDEEIELPVIILTKYIWRKLSDSVGNSSSPQQTQSSTRTAAVEKP
ncbi:uncharacterized protein LOC119641958 [Glossina fuscipes]|uniref:Uncharacterized protein LOC119641958 n=2 Tax=Nemorhina TaxID=44051 RepID=A0A9C5Z7W7_9MUSC|nr:uncharacterized protein LOC119641958 [Glossina fuscipes]